jgi:Tol biopolymer transport system component
MGEVYRARDTKLDREVAIKVLPEALAQHPDRLARFEREAKVLAALNHPNIATIYGLEDRAIVMELVEGPTLAERIRSGVLELKDALGIALAIASALEAAHDKGIVHRDLKPANIKAPDDGMVKVLDFGLATVAQGEVRAATGENSPTLTMGATEAGIILGTAAYMSPEQAAGKPVDKRADIWSFGVVLWAMLTGSRLFQGGETVSDTLADVLRAEIDFTKLPASTPQPIRQLLKRCLDRNVKTRLRDIGEARIVLANPAPSEPAPEVTPPSRLGLVWLGVAAVLLVALAILSLIHFREQPPPAEVIRFEIPPPEKAPFGIGPPVLSPDGRRLAFVTATVPTQIWVRSMGSLEARPLAGTEGGVGALFWSPDSQSIAFWTAPPSYKLKRAEISGGPAQVLCDTPNSPAIGAWNRDGVIIFHAVALSRVPAGGGGCTDLTTLDASPAEASHRFPSFLPDGRHFLYLRRSTRHPENDGIYVGSLDVKPHQQSLKRLMESDSGAVYAPSQDSKSGYLLFLREGTLMARPFNPDRLEFGGDAVPIAEHVAMPINPVGGYFSVSATGALAYRTGVSNGADLRLTWFDRRGNPVGTAPAPFMTAATNVGVSFSPDGGTVAFAHPDVPGGHQDIWLYEFARGTSTRFTFDPANDTAPVWSPDGKQIVFASERDGVGDLYRKASNNAGAEEPLFKSNERKTPSDWSRDGRFLLFQSVGPGSGPDIWYLPMTGANGVQAGTARPEVYLKTQFAELNARFSPDGRYVAYTSDETGKPEVYVRPFPNAAGGKWMVSKEEGGRLPSWRRDGKEFFYETLSGTRLMAVDVSLQPVFQARGVPKVLFDSPPGPIAYDVSADGQRFIKLGVPSENPNPSPSPITIVLNWQAGLKK